MNDLQVFGFEGKEVRVIVKNGEPWFVAKDVALALGYEWKGMSGTFPHVPSEWAGSERFRVRSENGAMQERELGVVSEQGLYFILGRSDKDATLPFQKLVEGTILPSIRKTGSYTVPSRESPQPQMPWSYYPFFMRPDSGDLFKEFMNALDENRMSINQFQKLVFSRETSKTVKAVTPAGSSASSGVYAQAVHTIRNNPRNPAVKDFADNCLQITGGLEDFVLPDATYNLFLKKTAFPLTRNKFIRELKKIDCRIIYKQKKSKENRRWFYCA
jgi:prophage antirepressor-like protein